MTNNPSYYILITIILLLVTHITHAQTITDTLEEVHIKRKKKQTISQDTRINDFTNGQKITTIDSLVLQQYKMQNAAQLLSQQTPVFIRSYGFNGLATLNFRGSSSAQSQVYWNGVPISNAALGMADISLLPVTFINNMQIVYGGSAALLGSGNVGGALLLETENPVFDTVNKTNYEIGLGAGSYYQAQLAGKMSYSCKKLFFSANAITQTAKNNFEYEINGLKRRNENSELKGVSAMTQIAYKLNGNNTIKAIAWYQKYDRNIPAALFESYSVKNRKDASLKLLAEWDREKRHSKQYLPATFITDKMNYEDTAIKLSTNNTSQQFYAEAGWKQNLSSRHKVLVFAPIHFSQMELDTSVARQSKYAIAVAYSYSDLVDKLNVSVNARGEIVNGKSYFLPGISASYQWFDWMKLRANIQRTYRVPTLNELYYEPGGNNYLKPEHGWAQDAGYTLSFHPTKNFSIHHDLAAYHRLINNWIVWYGGAIWTPHNIAKVRSTGVELEYLFKYQLQKLALHLGLKGNYTRAVTTESYVQGDGSVCKQIPYTPKYVGLINTGFTYKSYHFNYNHIYTGLRYFNADETGMLPSYQISNIQVSKDFSLGSNMLQTSLLVNNIFNEQYTVVAQRPMPGRNLSLSITLRKK